MCRLHHGFSCWALLACSSTSLWTPSTANRPGGLTAAHLWESSSTMAVTPSPQVKIGGEKSAALVEQQFHFCPLSPAISLCRCGDVHFVRNRPVSELDVLLWLHWDVHVLLRPVADLRVWDHALWPVSRPFCRIHFPNKIAASADNIMMIINTWCLRRIDVTEVQIAIIIMYLMSAFGGVGLWQSTVTIIYYFPAHFRSPPAYHPAEFMMSPLVFK